MKKFLVTLALLSMTTLVLGGCLEKLTGGTDDATPAEEVVTEEVTPVTPEVPAEPVAPVEEPAV